MIITILIMHILYVVENANLRGGTEILTFNLMHALRDEGMDCKILSIIPYTGVEENVISLSQEDYSLWTAKANSIINKLTFCMGSDRILESILRKKFEELRPQILVNQTYDLITALPVDLNVAQVFNWSVRGYEESLVCNIQKKGLIGRTLSLFANAGLTKRRHAILSRIPKLVTLSYAASAELKSLNPGVSDSQIAMIPDPITVNKDSLQVSTLENKNVVFVGRLSHEKGVMRLLRIWEKVSNQLPGYTLSIYGEGGAKAEMEQFLEQSTESPALRDSVKFKGFCRDLSQIYLNADLLLMTSDTEGFGMVLIEAMYYGVPCVTFDCPVSPKEIIADAGIAVPCFDEERYADEVIKLLCEPERMKVLKKRAIERAKDYYIDKVFALWMAMFNQK